MTDFHRMPLLESLSIPQLISFHYFEYSKGFTFEGEQHDFWELLYVDKGEVEVRADELTHTLGQGTMIFHKPEEFHTVRVDQGHKPPNLIVISFECDSPPMKWLERKVLQVGAQEHQLLSSIVQEGFRAFLPPYNRPDLHHVKRNPDAPFASEQSFKSYLEILLLRMIRAQMAACGEAAQPAAKLPSMQQDKAEQRIVQQVLSYMGSRLGTSLSLDELCREVHLGKSRLKEIFQGHTGSGVMEHFKLMKLEEAKALIREQLYTFTEIADRLGYASLHYFSRDFKKGTGMSPSEYARSVRVRG